MMKLLSRPIGIALAITLCTGTASLADPARDALLAGYEKAAGQPLSADRGEAFSAPVTKAERLRRQPARPAIPPIRNPRAGRVPAR